MNESGDIARLLLVIIVTNKTIAITHINHHDHDILVHPSNHLGTLKNSKRAIMIKAQMKIC